MSEADDGRRLRPLVLVLLAAKLVLLVTARPFMDETYYWMWGQHLALSYLDHPPLIGWTAAVGSLAGWTILGLRLFVLLTLAGDLAVLWLFARLAPADEQPSAFWRMAAMFLATPIFFLLSSVALPDHLLVFFTLVALYGFERFRRGWEAGAPAWRFLYLTAGAIGLATLSKYSGAFPALAAVLYVLARPGWRPLLRRWHFYGAVLLIVALQGPVLAWNLQNGFASFGFLFERRGVLHDFPSLTGLSGYLLGALLVLSPFGAWAMVRTLAARQAGGGFNRLVFWLSSLSFLVASLFTNILIHWNSVAYVALLPLLVAALRSRWLLLGQLAFGALAIAFVAVNYTLLPVTTLFGPGDQTSAWSYGWDEVAPRVRELEATVAPGFIATPDYALAAPLGFALHDADVTSLSPRREAYDFWFDAAAHAGETALLVTDRWRPLSKAIRRRFATVDALAAFDIVRFGHVVDHYVIYAAKGFSP